MYGFHRYLSMKEAEMDEVLREQVRAHYAEVALQLAGGGCECGCSTGPCCEGGDVSLGCGDPVAVAELRPGETVLDLGSGGGGDVIAAARRVGAGGVAYGLDMTDEMLELARRNAEQAGVANARFLKGVIEAIPLPDASIDV